MAIKINWNDLQKRFIGTTEIVRVYKSGVQVRPETLSDDYLCFELANGSWGTVTLNTYGTPTEVSLEYSYDKSTWTDYTIWDSISLTTWQKIYMRNKSTTPTWFSIYTGEDYRFLFEGNISASWDITYLLCKYGTTTLTSSYCFVNLFAGCTSLITAPSLPATTLTDNCYTQMFYGCTGLTTAPSLPATTLADWCYRVMFRGCTSLTTVPSLPATTLASWCYALMFQGCSNLEVVILSNSLVIVISCDSYSSSIFLHHSLFYLNPLLPSYYYHSLFGGFQSWLENIGVEKRKEIFGSDFRNYAKRVDMENHAAPVHGSFINVEHNNTLEFRLPRIVSHKQYIKIVKFWREVGCTINHFDFCKNADATTRKVKAKECGAYIVQIALKYFE